MRTRRIVIAGLTVLVVVAGLVVAGIEGWLPLGFARPAAEAASSVSAKASPSASSVPSAAPSVAADPSASPVASSSPTASSSPAAGPSTDSYTYSTPQPGPGCDKNGATWAENNVQFTGAGCDVEATVASQYGFLNVTLPGGQAFAPDNSVSITGSLGNSGDGYDAACLGLEEDGAAGGYLAAYCNDGDWYVYTTSGEVVGHQVSTGSIPMGINGTTYQMTLTLDNGTLSLTFNNVNAPGVFKVADLNISPFQPAQIGIGYQYSGYQVPAPGTDFVYTEL